MLVLQNVTAATKPVTLEGFAKAAGISVATAVAAAVVSMAIDNYSNVPCTVAKTCLEIEPIMKGEPVSSGMSCRCLKSCCSCCSYCLQLLTIAAVCAFVLNEIR